MLRKAKALPPDGTRQAHQAHEHINIINMQNYKIEDRSRLK